MPPGFCSRRILLPTMDNMIINLWAMFLLIRDRDKRRANKR